MRTKQCMAILYSRLALSLSSLSTSIFIHSSYHIWSLVVFGQYDCMDFRNCELPNKWMEWICLERVVWCVLGISIFYRLQFGFYVLLVNCEFTGATYGRILLITENTRTRILIKHLSQEQQQKKRSVLCSHLFAAAFFLYIKERHCCQADIISRINRRSDIITANFGWNPHNNNNYKDNSKKKTIRIVAR